MARGSLVSETNVTPNYSTYLYYIKGRSLYKSHKRTKAKTSVKANVIPGQRKTGYLYFVRPDGPRGTLNVYATKMAKPFGKGRSRRKSRSKRTRSRSRSR
tara:strand:- start:183 stop:482 length:300 start_codon:yes stop_codon:yes gene_type:complete